VGAVVLRNLAGQKDTFKGLLAQSLLEAYACGNTGLTQKVRLPGFERKVDYLEP
jgi:hypothetical protein